jgi:hypothetical protein
VEVDMTAGIYCIENDWWNNPKRKSTVEPILRVLWDHNKVPYVRRDVSTDSELEFHLREWASSAFDGYPFLYLALHGSEGEIGIRKKRKVENIRYHFDKVDLAWLQNVLANKCSGRIIMFASCSTLGVHGRRLQTFLKKTGAKAVLGYEDEVDWLEATTFELALLSKIPRRKRIHLRALTNAVALLRKHHRGLSKHLKFRSYRTK